MQRSSLTNNSLFMNEKIAHDVVFAKLSEIIDKLSGVYKSFHEFILEITESGITLGNGFFIDDGEMYDAPEASWIQLSSNDKHDHYLISSDKMRLITSQLNAKFPGINAKIVEQTFSSQLPTHVAKQSTSIILLNNKILLELVLPAFEQALTKKMEHVYK